MKRSRIFALSVASLLLTPFAAHAVTETWDGNSPNGGTGTSLFSNDLNWADNSAPVSNLATLDLAFAGTTKLSPSLDIVPFSANSVTFNNTAGVFIISGTSLGVGTGGVVNNDTQTMTLANPVDFGGVVTSTINAASGGLTFTNTVSLPTTTLTVTGGSSTSFLNFSGTSTVVKAGAGTMNWNPSSAIGHDLTINNGTVTLPTSAATDSFNATSTIAVNGSSTLNLNRNATFDGAQLTRAAGATLNLAAGKTYTIQNGGDLTIEDIYAHSTSASVAITGAGSTLSTTSILTFGGGSTVNVAAGGSISSASSQTQVGAALGNSTMTITDSGSSLSSGALSIGTSGNTGSVTFSNNSTGTVSSVLVDSSSTAGTSGTLLINAGADLTGTGLQLAPNAIANTGVITVTNNGSTLTLSGAATATIGAASASSGTLNVNNFGVFNSGTGLTTVNATGTIAVMGGEYNSNGNFTLNGGQVTVDSTGDFAVAPGTAFTIQADGVANLGDFFATNGSTFNVTGADSSASTSILFSVNNGTTALINNGATLQPGSVGIANGTGNGTLTIDGAGTQLTASSTILIALGSGVGNLTFSNGSTGNASQISVDDSSTNGGANGTLNIQSGATVSAGSLRIARLAGTHTGTLTIDGTGSALTISGAGTTTIGAASGSSGTLNVQNGGNHSSGTGLTTVNPTGTIMIAGGVYTSNGDLTLNGGQLTRDSSGIFTIASGKMLTVQAGGDAIFTGAFDPGTNTTVNVTGTGSTVSTNNFLQINKGSSATASAGGTLSGSGATIGTIGGNGTVTIDGSGSTFSSGLTNIGFNGFTGILTFSNGSSGTLGTVGVVQTTTNGTVGTINIQSGASVSTTVLNVAEMNGAPANPGTVTITGAGSVLTNTAATTLGAPSASNATGTLNVDNGGLFNDGFSTTINAKGTLNVNPGGTLAGQSDFFGTGPVNIAGTFLPGTASGPNQTTSVSFAQNMTFQPTTSITLELGGTTAGTQYDQLVFNGAGTPQVTWNGTLNVVLINGFIPSAGQSFDLFNFDGARDAGAFATVNLPALPAGLLWQTDQLYIDGTIRVSATATPTPTGTPTPTPPPVSISGTLLYCSNPVPGPVPNVTLALTGTTAGSTLSAGNGTYTFSSLPSGGNYTVTPSKAALAPGSTGITGVDAVAVQRHFLILGTPLSGCRLTAADVTGTNGVDGVDAVAVQRFFLGFTSGIANVGKYQFTPVNRSYLNLMSNQTAQNYDTLVFGDTASNFVERVDGQPPDAADDGKSADKVPAPVASVALPAVTVDASVTDFIVQVTTTAIDANNKLVGFQGDFTFDERAVTFQSEPVQNAGLTAGDWNVSANVLPGVGSLRTLRISAYSNDFTPLSGAGTLFELRMTRVSKAAQSTQLLWAAPPDQFIFIDADLKTQKPGYAAPGSVTPSGKRR